MEAVKINPDFSDLRKPETIINHFKDLSKQLNTKLNPFPIEVFPKPIQEIITSTNESLNFPIDFIGASILYSVSVSIGNTHKVELMKDWQENVVLYLVLVGKRGTSKSHPLDWALKPINELDKKTFQKYQQKKAEYDNILAFSKKEREAQGITEQPIKPIWEQHLVTDFTPEALIEVHKFNKRGIGVYVDELASWFKNFNRYNIGSEEQLWLSIWSGKPIRNNRKTSEPSFISQPFISVAGTIQTGVLNELAENRTENGFLDRLIFVVPDNLKKPYWSETELNQSIIENWQSIISNILDIPIIKDETDTPQPKVLRFTPEAKQLFFKWQRELTDESNKPENEFLSGINAKVEVYVIRLALLLQITHYACNTGDKQSIGIEAAQGAIKLVEYFKKTAIKVQSIISNVSPLNKLPSDKQALYNELPDRFTTSEGVKIAKNIGMAERTFKYFINNRNLFNNLKRGEYKKKF